jgi:hypothetical protein
MRRGFLFSTDAAFAATIALVAVATALYYSVEMPRDTYRSLNLMRTANDIGLSMDKSGALASNNQTLIGEILAQTTPSNMVSNIEVQRYYQISGSFEVVSVIRQGESHIETDYLTQEFISNDMMGGYYMTKIRVGVNYH